MDSIHSLRSSLPGRRRHDDSNLLTDFKAAAQSVTNLYKSAAAVQNKARSAGYQDALDDLLAFLDRENLGLMDGEGWRVRRWAHERLDDGVGKQAVSEDEEDGGKDEEVASQQAQSRSLSPEVRRRMPAQRVESEVVEPQGERDVAAEMPSSDHSTAPATLAVPPAQEPTLRATSAPAYPSNHDGVPESGMEVDNTSAQTTNEPSVRITARPPRNARHNRQRNGDGRPTTLNLNLGSGAGSKRKMPYPDLFDISGMNNDGHDRRDGQGGGRGGGKRGRFV